MGDDYFENNGSNVRKIEHWNEAFLLVFLWIYVRVGVAIPVECNFSA